MPTVAWYAFSAWFVSGVCVVLAVLRVSRAARLGPPASERLLSELLSETDASGAVSDRARQIAIADLNERLSDVEFELTVLPARLIALTRISFASGTGLALFGYIGASESSTMIRVLGFASCVGAGAIGAAVVLAAGRMAKRQAAQIREDWDRTSRELGRVLGTSLTTAGDGRGRGA